MTITRQQYAEKISRELEEIGAKEMLSAEHPQNWHHPKRPIKKDWLVWHPKAQGGGRLFFATHKEGLEWIRKYGGTLVRNQIGAQR